MRLAERTLYPWLVVSQTLPVIALAPILVTWFGYGPLPKALVVVLFCFIPITVAAGRRGRGDDQRVPAGRRMMEDSTRRLS